MSIPMWDSTPDVVHQPILDRVLDYPLFDPDAELFPETTELVQCFQNSHPSRNCVHGPDHQLALELDLSVSRTSIGGTPDNSHIQSVTTLWRTSATGQLPLHEPFAPNELTVSYWSEMYEDDFVTGHYPAFMAPTMPQTELLRTETLRDQSRVSSLPSPISPGGVEEIASESLLQAGSQSPSQKCYILWRKIPMDAIIVTGFNKFVPQRLYRPLTETDKERYLERASLSAPIIFVTKEPLEWGISLEDIRNGGTQHLVDKNDLVLKDCGTSVSIRINWPGYPPFKRQISSRNWRKMKGPITKAKLAQSLAKTTGRFIEKMSNKPLEVGTERSWKVGPQYIKVEDLILVSLHHVSKGSWQPQFRLRRDVA